MIESTQQNTIVDEKPSEDEIELEKTLRPQNLSEYIGQEDLKKSLNIIIQAAKKRQEYLEHLLFYGPPGLGKTTLANILAKEMGVSIKTITGPAIEKAGDLASILTNLTQGDILFIDEIHRLNKAVEEILYPALEDFVLDIVLGKGPGARSIRMDLPRFTLIGATTRAGLISSPLRDRFGASFRLEYYEPSEIAKILKRSAMILNTKISEKAADLLSSRCRFTPRIANRLLKRVRDFAQVKGNGTIETADAVEALKLLDIDEIGLDKNDRRILECIIEKFSGGPVGLSTLAAATGEEEDTITDVHEPFLIRLGMLNRTPKGRTATENAYKHLGLKPKNPKTLF